MSLISPCLNPLTSIETNDDVFELASGQLTLSFPFFPAYALPCATAGTPSPPHCPKVRASQSSLLGTTSLAMLTPSYSFKYNVYADKPSYVCQTWAFLLNSKIRLTCLTDSYIYMSNERLKFNMPSAAYDQRSVMILAEASHVLRASPAFQHPDH